MDREFFQAAIYYLLHCAQGGLGAIFESLVEHGKSTRNRYFLPSGHSWVKVIDGVMELSRGYE